MKNKELLRSAAFSLFLIVFAAMATTAQTTEFTYQGRLNVGGNPASGDYEVQFTLFSVATGGTPIGTRTRVTEAINGTFMVRLDFALSAFNGFDRWIEVAVRPAGSPNPFVTLLPRQPVTHVPYAFQSIKAAQADTAANSQQLGGVPGEQFVQTNDSRLSDARAPTAGSNFYIQNNPGVRQTANFNIDGNGTIGGNLTVNGTLTADLPSGDGSYIQSNPGVQQAANFNINGNGTANIFNAVTQFQIGANRVLGVPGTNNLFVGVNTGNAITSGEDDVFVGRGSGSNNMSGSRNSFFGKAAGQSNVSGHNNAFFGFNAGRDSTAHSNSFFGSQAGELNTTGTLNSFFGNSAGQANTTGSRNSFFGANTGANSTGAFNSFFGASAGAANTTGNQNSFFGDSAGIANTTGADNSFFGAGAGLLTTASNNSFFGSFAGNLNTTGIHNTFVGRTAGNENTSGFGNSFFGAEAGRLTTIGIENVLVGRKAGQVNTLGSNNTIVGAFADVGSNNLNYATAIGSGAVVTTSNTIVLGRTNGEDTVEIPGDIRGNDVTLFGFISLAVIGSGGTDHLCLNSLLRISNCSSSLRYKTNIEPFSAALNLVKRLRPITFDWKDGGMHDLGLGAEDVAAIEPLLVTYNKNGQVEGVKYDRIGVVLVNAVKEQQKQIELQQKQIEEQRIEIDVLKAALCQANPRLEFCVKEQK